MKELRFIKQPNKSKNVKEHFVILKNCEVEKFLLKNVTDGSQDAECFVREIMI